MKTETQLIDISDFHWKVHLTIDGVLWVGVWEKHRGIPTEKQLLDAWNKGTKGARWEDKEWGRV